MNFTWTQPYFGVRFLHSTSGVPTPTPPPPTLGGTPKAIRLVVDNVPFEVMRKAA